MSLFKYIRLQSPLLSPLESTLGGNTHECNRLPMNSSGSEAGNILKLLIYLKSSITFFIIDLASEEILYSSSALIGSDSKSLLKFGSPAALRSMSLTTLASLLPRSNQNAAY